MPYGKAHKQEGIYMSPTQRGFSLVELMVVSAVIVILGLVAIPSLVTTYPTYKLKKTSRDLCSNMRKARSMAIKLNRNITIEFNVANRTYSIDGGVPIQLESGIEYGHGSATIPSEPDEDLPADGVSFENNSVTFNSRGLVTPATNRGNVYLFNKKGSAFCIGVTTIVGTIALRQWTGSSWQ